MGHLIAEDSDKIHQDILDFAYSKVKLYIKCATDTDGLGCMFYILRDGLQPVWKYYYGDSIVEIDWSDCLLSKKTHQNIRFI